MTRVIEFKVWDNKKKEIRFVEQLCFLTKMIQARTCDWLDPTGSVLMQYTGIEDIKGMKMFEDDIVKFDSYYSGDYKIPAGKGVIVYDNGSYMIMSTDSPELCSENVKNHSIEVIGNIHTNFIEASGIIDKLIENQKDLPEEFYKTIDENFWELI